MKQCKYEVYFINGEKVFKSVRTGRKLTGAAKVACERAEAEKAAREQRAIDEAVENAFILTWYEENAVEIDAEQERNIARAKALAENREVKSDDEGFEEFCDALDAVIYEEKKAEVKRIAITGWALNARMIRDLESAFEDEDVKEMLTNGFRKSTAEFVRSALACMGWKYNAGRGTTKGAVIEFLRRRDDERFPIYESGKYNIASVFNAMRAVTRCMIYAKERSENAVVIKREYRASLARLCRKMIQGIQTITD